MSLASVVVWYFIEIYKCIANKFQLLSIWISVQFDMWMNHHRGEEACAFVVTF